MDAAARKALIAEYKDRPTIAGVYAVVCTATGQVWVGQSRHIETRQNGLWFTLKTGGGRDPSLQAALAARTRKRSPMSFRRLAGWAFLSSVSMTPPEREFRRGYPSPPP